MKRRPDTTMRMLAVTLSVAAILAACTRTPPGGLVVSDGMGGVPVQATDPTPSGGTGSTTGGLGSSPQAGGTTGRTASGSATGSSGTTGSSTGTGTTGASDPGTAGTGGTDGGGATTGGTTGDVQGVEGRTVKFVYSTKLQDCGDDPSTSSQSTANEKGLRILDEWVTWFNEQVLAEVDWTLEYEVVDDGGPFCPEKAQAAALKIVKELKPFAVLSDLVQPARGPIVADAVSRAGIVHIGASWSTAAPIRDRAPYVWPAFPVGERLFENLAGWMEQRIKGTQTTSTRTGIAEDRVYGLLAVDSPDGRALAASVHSQLTSRGIQPAQTYIISGDAGVAAQQASNLALKMSQDGINSLVLAVPYPSAVNSTIVLSEAMNSQNYLPDIFVGNYGLSLFDSIHNKRVWAKVQGTSNMPALVLRWAVAPNSSGQLETVEEFEEIPENESGWIKVYQEKLGYNDAPGDGSVPAAYTTWTQLSLLATGLLHLEGPLTPENFGKAVHSARMGGPNRCTVGRFMMRDYIYSPGLHWEWGNSGLRSKSTSLYWVNRQTPMGSNGYYESFDNYQFFGAEEWPAEHTRDTGQQGVDIPKQERIGIRPWTPCSQFPNYPG